MSDIPRGSLAELRLRLVASQHENAVLRQRLRQLEQRLSMQSAAARILAEPRGEVAGHAIPFTRAPGRDQ